MAGNRFIHIRNWDRYQHPDVTRNKEAAPRWIKDAVAQLNDGDFMELGFADRGLLQSLRLQYAANRGRGMVDSTTNLSRLLGQRVYRSQLERLSDAGLIEFSASKSLATRLRPASLEETKTKKEKDQGLFVASNANGAGPGDLTPLKHLIQFETGEVEDFDFTGYHDPDFEPQGGNP